MASSPTALSLSDLPFMYSFVNLLFILITGQAKIENFYIVGLIAGIIGTFLVFWHPIQWSLDKFMTYHKKEYAKYRIVNNTGVTPPQYELQISDWFNLSLKTSAIKYLKDKISSQIYFFIILSTIGLALFDPNFQKALNLENTYYRLIIQLGIWVMLIGLSKIFIKSSKEFINNVKITSIYFLISNSFTRYSGQSTIIKEAIDLNDWDTAKVVVDKTLYSYWDSLKSFAVEK